MAQKPDSVLRPKLVCRFPAGLRAVTVLGVDPEM
jgi:hypothetical protein